MNTFKKKMAGVVLAGTLGMGGAAQAADIVIGVPNWPSVAMTADILKVVIEDNYGLEVELQNGTNPVVFEAMDGGSMHVHPEVWLPNQSNLHNTFVKEKGTVSMNPNGVPAFQGMCVTKATADKTGIKALSDLSDPDMAITTVTPAETISYQVDGVIGDCQVSTSITVTVGSPIGVPNSFTPNGDNINCLLYTSPSPRDVEESRMPSSA